MRLHGIIANRGIADHVNFTGKLDGRVNVRIRHRISHRIRSGACGIVFIRAERGNGICITARLGFSDCVRGLLLVFRNRGIPFLYGIARSVRPRVPAYYVIRKREYGCGKRLGFGRGSFLQAVVPKHAKTVAMLTASAISGVKNFFSIIFLLITHNDYFTCVIK